jgi:hypothetical protein
VHAGQEAGDQEVQRLAVTCLRASQQRQGGDNKQLIGANSVYVDGERGVCNLRINGCSGSYDATFGLVTSYDRYVLLAFPNKTASSLGTPPKWAGSGSFVANPYANVRDTLWGRRKGQASCDGTYPFTTQMSIGYIRGPGNQSDCQLRFHSSGADAPETSNTGGPKPSEPGTALVTVVDTPCGVNDSVYDSWTVTIAPSPVLGALYKTKNTVPAGTYDMPIRLRFTAQSCLDP